MEHQDNMSRYFNIQFSDLSFEKQQDMIASIKETLLAEYKEEGERVMNDKWHIKPKTWQEAYCRFYNVDWRIWNDLKEDSKEFQEYNWSFSLDTYAESEAEDKLSRGFKYTEVEVEL